MRLAGNPARRIGWVCACGERLEAPWACTACGRRYRLAGEDVGLVEDVGPVEDAGLAEGAGPGNDARHVDDGGG